MKKNYIIYTIVAILMLPVQAQKGKYLSNKALEMYKNLSFADASNAFKKAIKKGYSSAEMYRYWANSQYFNGNYEDAVKGYTELFSTSDNTKFNLNDYIRYSQSLNAQGDKQSAQKYYQLFLAQQAEKRGEYELEDYLQMIEENSNRYNVEPLLGVNTDKTEYGAAFYKDYFIFSSNRDSVGIVNYKDSWTNDNFLNLYAVKSENEELVDNDVKRLRGKINARGGHTTSACFTKDGKTMYFTKSSGKNKENGFDVLKIYRATLKEGKWSNIEELPINGNRFSTAHPALSPAEDRLYFASDRPEAIGGTDIFYAPIYSGGKIGRVESVGSGINTYGRESFPFISDRDELYFSSDGHFGLGGYDIFYSKKEKDSFGNVLNVGAPVNSSNDDFAFYMNIDNGKGFFSSNRNEHQDDIFAVEELSTIKDVFVSEVNGLVYERIIKNDVVVSTNLLSEAMVYLLDENNTIIDSMVTSREGAYHFPLNRFKNYKIIAKKDAVHIKDEYGGVKKISYINSEIAVSKGKRVNNLDDIVLVKTGSDLFTDLKLEPILFDFDRANIRSDAAIELDKIIAYLKKHKEVKKVSIRSHTDSKGAESYNLKLSEKRAKSTYEYMVANGISRSRLLYKGFGESKPVNECVDGETCSEMEYQDNRRSEFIVMEIDGVK
ncbi:OmpA family protein [Galbibacter mesophilus]|uniref:OmpA family protein n=1 Tax=Galbibacter mesophilus TaxID=379069 RepID=UPI00191DB752|nr:OmpA family protein [Galbibacter mesophilus]MCM5661355.1 OmpA family protein [Galbibacter mesophilus]